MCEPVATAASSGSTPSLHKSSKDKVVSVVSKLRAYCNKDRKGYDVNMSLKTQLKYQRQRDNYKYKY